MIRTGIFILLAMSLIGTSLTAEAPVPTTALPKLKPGDPLPANLFIELAKAVNPAVVNIFTTYLPKRRQMQRDPYRDPFFDLFEEFMGNRGLNQPAPQQALGTGFIIREDGLIITNNHVIDRADVIKVQLEERTKESYDAKVIGRDPKTDIALIKIDAKKKLPFARVGSSSDLQVGEWVAAFGNPYGYGHTMTKGIISAIGREIDELNLSPFIQTDASINPGNSGGPLVNTQGQVIGVNAAIDARAQGIGFVIPIDTVKAILPTLEKEGSIKRGYLGVELADIDEESAGSLNLKSTEGALITDVQAGTAAEGAGLKPFDLVVEFNEKKITSPRDLRREVLATPVGTSTSIKVVRNGKPMSLKIKVAAPEALAGGKPSTGPRGGRGGSGAIKGVLTAPYGLGFAVIDYQPAVAQEFHLPALRQPHPVIVSIEAGSEAARAGLSPGDIILDINRKDVSRAKDVAAALKGGTLNILRVLKPDRVVLVSLRAR